MSSTELDFDQINDAALALPEALRELLAYRLVRSIPGAWQEPEVDAELIAEAERRVAEFEAGSEKAIPYEEAMRQIRKSLDTR